ncbi:hypothetical protein H6B11_01885 [Mediterraneibacter glycyrrhizinilyticus]|nr:hypothetical protein [Mediterraneibacter glycyrrhizinilyticus]MBM6852917.1 hypothetical protein [Mediterraneibacter glycyrrhizinilyticus]
MEREYKREDRNKRRKKRIREKNSCSRRILAGSEEAFVEMMNEKAAKLGMTDTHFMNVTGLQDEEHYTTVKDMSVLLQNALENRLFRQIFCTREYTASPTEQHPQGLSFGSSMFRLAEDWQVNGGEIRGGKTGFTDQAGLCLASLAHVDNRDYILVTAKADGNHQTEPYHALDALNLYGQIRKEIPVKGARGTIYDRNGYILR